MGQSPDSIFSLRPIVVRHWRAMKDSRTGEFRRRDALSVVAVPVLAGVLVFVGEPSIDAVVTGATAAIGLLAAYLFGLAVSTMEKAATWADSHREVNDDTSRHADRLLDLAAHAAYGSVCALATAALLVVAGSVATHGRFWLALATVVGVHLGVSFVLTVRRVFLLTRHFVTVGRTGQGGT